MIGGAPAPQIPDRELPMSRRFIALRAAIAAVAAWLFMSAGPVAAQAPALSGKIASDREGPMEGVLVSAKKPGGTITVTVVSDAKGDYAFPADRLELGRYELMIRAAGPATRWTVQAHSSLRQARRRRPTCGSSRLRLPPIN